MAKHHDVKIIKTRTVGALRQDYMVNIQTLMNLKVPRFQRDKALRDMIAINAALYDQKLAITVVIEVVKLWVFTIPSLLQDGWETLWSIWVKIKMKNSRMNLSLLWQRWNGGRFLLSDAAGDWTYYYCPNPECKKRIKIYSRSFAGNGRNCPHCKVHIPPAILVKGTWVPNKLKLHRNQKDDWKRLHLWNWNS